MEEIEVGDYVRTVEGHIFKRDNNINTNYFSYGDKLYAECHYLFLDDEEVTKHSFNIIDLIEVGDIIWIKDSVYGIEYLSEVFADYDNVLCINNFETTEIIELTKNIEEERIKLLSILTKEQYTANAYRLE